ncbi:hypothetical protein AALP_AAs60120U000100 [Arabis alpina]|uniref:Uncharacterized protein n=1 Tax=Arabis alpina TaxID=50452 RepID=A0A087FWE4_ARAAL|nr:hypothetical protein AALP_AAs60120U000100 [Arabis alpina]
MDQSTFQIFHRGGQINNRVWETFDRKWLGQAKSLCTPEDSEEFRLDNVEAEINLLEHELHNECFKQHDIGFCHNDLQYGNIMIDEDTNVITIIDYESCYFDGQSLEIFTKHLSGEEHAQREIYLNQCIYKVENSPKSRRLRKAFRTGFRFGIYSRLSFRRGARKEKLFHK